MTTAQSPRVNLEAISQSCVGVLVYASFGDVRVPITGRQVTFLRAGHGSEVHSDWYASAMEKTEELDRHCVRRHRKGARSAVLRRALGLG